MFKRLFEKLTPKTNSVGIVEAMHSAGIDSRVLETLPEAVLTPLKDSIARCQARPPPSWPKDLLELVNRGDVSMILAPSKKLDKSSASILVSIACPFSIHDLTSHRHPLIPRLGITELFARALRSTTTPALMKERAPNAKQSFEPSSKKTAVSMKHRSSYQHTEPVSSVLKPGPTGLRANTWKNRRSSFRGSPPAPWPSRQAALCCTTACDTRCSPKRLTLGASTSTASFAPPTLLLV